MYIFKLRRRHGPCAAAALLGVSLAGASQAAVFRCVDANGTNTYSDKPCAAAAPTDATRSAHTDLGKATKALQILQWMQWMPGADPARAQRIVDQMAPELVKRLDPSNEAWNPQHAKWDSVLKIVTADLSRDAQTALRGVDVELSRAAIEDFSARAGDAHMDALIRYLSSPEGARYLAFQNEMRAVMDPRSATDQPPESVLKQRQQVLSLGIESRLSLDGQAQRSGAQLDMIYAKYQAELPGFATFSQSAMAQRLFAAAEPVLRANGTLLKTATGEFADVEERRYAQRWRAAYGPPMQRAIVVGNRKAGSS